MAKDKILGKMMVFKDGSDDALSDLSIAIELTEMLKDGTIELTFPDRRKGRIYLRFSLPDLMAMIADGYGNKD